MSEMKMRKNLFIIMILLTSVYGKSVFAQVSKNTIENTILKIKEKNQNAQEDRIIRGVNQAAAFWTEKDGSNEDFEKFCIENFISNYDELQNCFVKISNNLESILGCFNKISVDLKLPLHLDLGKISNIDEIFGRFKGRSQSNKQHNSGKVIFNR